jgi:hypothetical protein
MPKSDWEKLWNERKKRMEALLGRADNEVLHSVVPLFLGGGADVLCFKKYVRGFTYVTSELTGSSDQPPNKNGSYELMICTWNQENWAANLISRLASYTFESRLNPGETMDIGSAMPKGSKIVALLFTEPELKKKNRFKVDKQSCSLLLCIGITKDELKLCLTGGTKELLQKLKNNNVFPYTHLKRKSVL